MLTTDQSLTLQGLLRIMTPEEVLLLLSNNLIIKADDSAQDGRFGDEKHYLKQSAICEHAISRLRELERRNAVL